MKITVCIGSFCHVKGAPQVIAELQRLIEEHHLKDHVELAGKFCMKKCQGGTSTGVNVDVDGTYYDLAPQDTERFFQEHVLLRARG